MSTRTTRTTRTTRAPPPMMIVCDCAQQAVRELWSSSVFQLGSAGLIFANFVFNCVQNQTLCAPIRAEAAEPGVAPAVQRKGRKAEDR
eukprot:1001743-Rhodomonas_salina.2